MKKIQIEVETLSLRTHGIKSPDGWYNIPKGLSEQAKAELTAKVSKIERGDVIELDLPDDYGNVFCDVKLIERPERKNGYADDYVGFDTLLLEAHKKYEGKLSIQTTMLMKPDGTSAMTNGWMCYAIIKADQQTFTAHGDATEENTNGNIKIHLPRMAETRALARALRFLLGKGVTVEEFGPDAPSKPMNRPNNPAQTPIEAKQKTITGKDKEV